MNRASPDWTLWRSFGAVIEQGSLSGAARQLGVSQPTIGRHIQTLESELGATLFIRTIKGFEPNASAMRLFEQVKMAKNSLSEAAILAEGSNAKLSGAVRITASTITSHYILPKMLAQLREQFPSIEIELVPSDSAENLLMRECDIAVRMFRPTQLELIARKIGQSPMTCCAHTQYLAKNGAPKDIKDLYDFDLVGFDRSELLLSVARQLGFDLQRHHFTLRTDSQTAMWEMIKAGLGIGFAQTVLVDAEPEIETILSQLIIPPLQIWLTTHKELFTSARIRVIYDRLGELLGDYFSTE
ncbi:Transcriptional regulator, LysR family [hydrothermal vent metagenome]|uniref:Transcriptional regulator, LysR family n=1 Tax=hydrothermal vent metagenome TaxID=652676 RepID=A0A3B0TTS3_9ZZZZ